MVFNNDFVLLVIRHCRTSVLLSCECDCGHYNCTVKYLCLSSLRWSRAVIQCEQFPLMVKKRAGWLPFAWTATVCFVVILPRIREHGVITPRIPWTQGYFCGLALRERSHLFWTAKVRWESVCARNAIQVERRKERSRFAAHLDGNWPDRVERAGDLAPLPKCSVVSNGCATVPMRLCRPASCFIHLKLQSQSIC